MQTDLKIALLSHDITYGDKQANLQAVANYCSSIDKDVDIIVLPELFSTGYTSSREKLLTLAETNGGDTIAFLHEIAKKHNAAITGSFLAKTGSNIFNRAFFIEPSGDECFYDKRHLFSMSSESSVLTAGEHRALNVRFRGWSISVVICYDLRFPVWCRNINNAYDLMIVPANWPNSREFAWTHLLQARAIENQAYVIGLNRSGNDKFGDYNSMTSAFDFSGHTVRQTPSGHANLSFVKLSLSELTRWRNDFPVWKDSDSFYIEI